MKEQGKDNAAEKMNEDESKKAKKAARRSRKSAQHQFGFGGLPSSMDDVAKVTTQSDSGVARSIDVAPPMTNPMKTLPGMQPGSMMPPPSLFGGAKMNPSMLTAGRMAAPSSGRSKVVAASAAARVEPNGWTFRDVPTLPERHPLEMTAVFVPHTDAPSVGERVATALRERSVAAVYDDAKAKASCKTMYGVEFRVRLYRGKGEKFGHGVIVEVQRRLGFSPAFAADARAVLDAAEGKKEAALVPLPLPMPSKLLPTVTDDDDDDDFDAPAPFTGGMKRPAPGPPSLLSISSAMLKRSKTADAAELALKGIADATDPGAVGPAAALRATRQLFEGEDTVAKDAISSLLVDDALEGIAEDQQDGAPMPELRRHAVTAVSNSISNAATSPTFLNDQSSFFADDVVPAVVSDLRQAQSDPLMAAASARCLKGLVSGNRQSPAFRDDMKRVAAECGAAEALEKALEAGQRGSSDLERESRRCLEALS